MSKERKITPVQEAITFWTERYKEAKEAGATKTMEAADLFLQYLEVMLNQEHQFMSDIWDAAAKFTSEEEKSYEGHRFKNPDKQQFLSQYSNDKS